MFKVQVIHDVNIYYLYSRLQVIMLSTRLSIYKTAFLRTLSTGKAFFCVQK